MQCSNKKVYTKTFVSFQSTSGTNIIGVNNLPSVHLYVGKKERGSECMESSRMRLVKHTLPTSIVLTMLITWSRMQAINSSRGSTGSGCEEADEFWTIWNEIVGANAHIQSC